MNLNPLALIEKLIVEHGSASVLKERLELIRDQVRLKDEQIASVQAEINVLRLENERLLEQVGEQEAKLAQFSKKPSPISLEEAAVKILSMMDHAKVTRVRDFVFVLDMTERQVMHYLLTLESKSMVDSCGTYSRDPTWDTGYSVEDSMWILRSRGLKYLAENSLL